MVLWFKKMIDTTHAKKQVYIQKKHQLIANPEIKEMIELSNKDIKTIITVQIFKENMKAVSKGEVLTRNQM